MIRMRFVAMIAVVGCLVGVAPTDTFAQTGMSEAGIRRFATHKPLPAYPAASVAKGTSGVAVAAIASSTEGNVSSVTVLEAPDEAIAEAVRSALLAWKIPPVTTSRENRVTGVRGKVTFYFRITGGRGRVFNPEEMPGGPKPEPDSGPPSAAPGARPSSGPPSTSTPRPASSGSHGAELGSEISESAFTAMAASKPILLDIRERDEFKRQHRPGAINIPGEELSIRGYIELEAGRPVVIDCTFTEARVCHNAASRLRPIPKIGKVFVLLP